MRIALAQLNFIIGDFDYNQSKIFSAIVAARQQQADLVIFPELAVCGYPPLDFLEFDDFIKRCTQVVQAIAMECRGITAIVGSPAPNPVREGKNLFNAAFVCAEGKVQQVIHKSLLPNYDVFDEYRYFEPGTQNKCVEVNGTKIALTICEDLWNIEDDPMYIHCPMDNLAKEKPELIINIAASPFDYNHYEKRISILQRNARLYKLPLVYVNHTGAQTELIFDGASLVMDSGGNVLHELKSFSEDIFVFNHSSKKAGLLPVDKEAQHQKYSATERIYHALVLGIKDYFNKSGFTNAVLGLSGGIDSAVVAALAADALGPQNVLGVMMPSEYSSAGSVTDSEELANKLGIQTNKIPIHRVFNLVTEELKPHFKKLPADVTEENIQARIRAIFLMALSNKHGYILLNTSNKSELSVGYGTLYGDLSGGLSVIGDVYKTQVYELARFLNRHHPLIPAAIIDKAPSAELRPDQKDSDSLPEYAVLDPLLNEYIEQRKSPAELIDMGFDAALVKRVMRLVNSNEYKRFQAPPILRVSPKAFGLGRRMPIVGKYLQ